MHLTEWMKATPAIHGSHGDAARLTAPGFTNARLSAEASEGAKTFAPFAAFLRYSDQKDSRSLPNAAVKAAEPDTFGRISGCRLRK